MLLKDVRGRLLQYATEAWIEHSPRVVAGMEERLRQRASTATLALPIPPASTTETGPSAGSNPTVLLLLGEYVRCVKDGSMTQAEFDKLSDVLLSTSQDSHSVHSPSATMSPPSLQTSQPLLTKSGHPVPSSSSVTCTAPPAVANPVEVTVRPVPDPIRQATATAVAGLVVSQLYVSDPVSV